MNWGLIMDVAVATIVGALIAVTGSIIMNFFGNRKGYKDIVNKIGKCDNTTLSGQHIKLLDTVSNAEKITNEINSKLGNTDNTSISRQNEDIIHLINDISDSLEREKNSRIDKLSLLNGEMSIINNSIENLSCFSEIMKNLTYENAKLKTENETLRKENDKLKSINSRLSEAQRESITQRRKR